MDDASSSSLAVVENLDVARAPQMAPAHGLYLADVAYLENYAVRPAYGVIF